MKILFVSEDLVAGDLARKLGISGHDVRFCIKDRRRKDNFSGLVQKTSNWKKDLKWVKKDGLIIFDSCSDGNNQELLREKGYSVVGGCDKGDEIEGDRNYCSQIFSRYGLKKAPLLNFKDISEAIKYIKKNPGKWVVKQNAPGTGLKSLNYVGQMKNGEDVINVLEDYKEKKYKGVTSHSKRKSRELRLELEDTLVAMIGLDQ